MTPLKEADRLFSLFIRERDGACRRCGGTYALQCHHLIPRVYRKVRFEPDNGVSLCSACHMYVTHRPLEAEELAIEWIGAQRYDELRVIARDTSYKVDLKAVVKELRGKVAA